MRRFGVLFALAVAAGWASAGQETARAPRTNADGAPVVDERDVAVPGNGDDSCAAAAVISGYRSLSFNLTGATTDGLAHSVCLAFGSDQIWRDRWWSWTAPATGLTRIETCGQTTADTRMAVYAPASPCPPTSEYLVACNDDGCGTQSSVTFIAQAGQTYLVRLGLFGATEPAGAGSGTFRIGAMLTPDICPDDAGPCQTVDLTNIAFNSIAQYRVADDFTPAASGAMEGICWWGSYPSFAPATDGFVITYWTTAAGFPGIPIASFSQSGSLAVQRVATNNVDIVNSTMFLYSATHAPVPMAKGVRYWVEIRNMYGSSWFWQASQPTLPALQDLTPPSNWGDAQAISNTAWCAVFNTACDYDTNGDGLVNFADLNNIISFFNTVCP